MKVGGANQNQKIVANPLRGFILKKMDDSNILSEFNTKDVKEFTKEFTKLMCIVSEIDRYYGEADESLDVLIPNLEISIKKFNKKYPGIRINTKKTTTNFKLRLFIKEHNIKEFFANVVSRISGLNSVGNSGFNQVVIDDTEKIAKFLDFSLDKIYMVYIDKGGSTIPIIASISKKEKMIELICESSDFSDKDSPLIKMFTFYAVKNINRKINVYEHLLTFGFTNLLDEIEKREWSDKWKKI